MSEPVLNEGDLQSVVWQKLKAHLEHRLDELRKQNDNTQSEVETAKLRGRIAEIKETLALSQRPPKFKDSSGSRY